MLAMYAVGAGIGWLVGRLFGITSGPPWLVGGFIGIALVFLAIMYAMTIGLISADRWQDEIVGYNPNREVDRLLKDERRRHTEDNQG
jgi:cation transporter-like permease